MRLVAFEDSVYHRDGQGLSCELSFSTFVWALAEHADALVVLGRLHPAPGRVGHAVTPPFNAAFEPLPFYASLLDVRGLARALPGVARRIWRALGDADAVWVNGPSPVAVLVALLGLARRRRVVLGVRQDTREYARHRFPGRRAPQLAFRLMDGAWRLLARRRPVTLVGAQLHDSYRAAPRRLCYYASLVAEAELASAGEAGGHRTTTLSVGRLDPEKNPLLLPEIAALLPASHTLVIVGDGSQLEAVRRRVAQLGVEDRVELAGYLEGAALRDHYRRAGQLLHVSWTEGLPQVLLEAFGARLPVVATAVGGVPALASGSALLVEPGDAQAAAAAVRRVVEEDRLRERLCDAGARIAARHTLEAEAARVAAFIRGG